MAAKQRYRIHAASLTYREDTPERLLETLWVERPGWGYLKRRDQWVLWECTREELVAAGYVLRRPVPGEEVLNCPHCGMYMCSIPGYLVHKHIVGCGGGAGEGTAMEESLIQDQRMKRYAQKILADKMREAAELEEMERRERFDKIRDEQLARQGQKDRKKRLKEQTKEDWKKR
jgi:hypothetical protein